MSKIIYSGIDIGSRNIKIISVEYDDVVKKTKIIANKSFLSRGVKDGYISNKTLFLKTLKEIKEKYKKDFGIDITEAIITISSIGLKSELIKISHLFNRKKIVDDVDVLAIQNKVKKKAGSTNSYILDLRIKSYQVNGYKYYSELKDLVGFEAKKIDVEYVMIKISRNHFKIIEDVFNSLDIEILDINSGNILSAEFNTSVEDRELGLININIGSEVTSYSIWENNRMVYLDHISFGGERITNTISLKAQTGFQKAEEMKKKAKVPKNILKEIEDEVDILTEQIKAKLIELNLIDLLPGGIVLYGGGAKMNWLRDIIKQKLSMPVKANKKFSSNKIDYNDIYSSLIIYIKKDVLKKSNGIIKWIKKVNKIFKR